MKLIVNYDLLNKIKESKTGMNLQKNIINELRIQSFALSLGCVIDLLILGKPYVFNNLLFCGMYFIPGFVMLNIIDKAFQVNNKRRANMELTLLSARLNNNLKINTNLDLIKESGVYKTEYKIIKNKDNIPVIKQDKYIMIPTYNGMGDITETSVLQEHNLGSKEYILSIGSPNKVLKLKPVFNV